MGSSTSKKRRKRRTNNELEDIFFASVKELIETHGFSNLTLSKIVQHANIEPCVFYKRYNDLEDFLDKFVREYDYWVSDSMSFNPKLDPISNYKTLMANLIDSFWDNKIMQKLIAWEVNEVNYITLRSAKNRDANSQHLIQYFTDSLANCSVNFNVSTAILIGGLYYLVIHKDMATFNNIDFSTEDGLKLLKENMLLMIEKIFNDHPNTSSSALSLKKNIKAEKLAIAKKLKERNIDYDIIKDATGLSDKDLNVIE